MGALGQLSSDLRVDHSWCMRMYSFADVAWDSLGFSSRQEKGVLPRKLFGQLNSGHRDRVKEELGAHAKEIGRDPSIK